MFKIAVTTTTTNGVENNIIICITYSLFARIEKTIPMTWFDEIIMQQNFVLILFLLYIFVHVCAVHVLM